MTTVAEGASMACLSQPEVTNVKLYLSRPQIKRVQGDEDTDGYAQRLKGVIGRLNDGCFDTRSYVPSEMKQLAVDGVPTQEIEAVVRELRFALAPKIGAENRAMSSFAARKALEKAATTERGRL